MIAALPARPPTRPPAHHRGLVSSGFDRCGSPTHLSCQVSPHMATIQPPLLPSEPKHGYMHSSARRSMAQKQWNMVRTTHVLSQHTHHTPAATHRTPSPTFFLQLVAQITRSSELAFRASSSENRISFDAW